MKKKIRDEDTSDLGAACGRLRFSQRNYVHIIIM